MRRKAVLLALLAGGCAETASLEPSSSAVGGLDASACGVMPCSGGGGASSGSGGGGAVGTGGLPPQTGGAPATGGIATGGANAGGTASGGVGTGGAGTGGVATGGVATGGGKATGGTSTGGVATGGASTGGAATGGSKATGGAATGGAGTGGASACPNYPTGDDCSRCICARCATQVASCYSSSDATKNQQCRRIQECAEQNQCASSPCYCGPNDAFCTSADGPCVAVIQEVVGSSDLLNVLGASNDTNHPLGRANQIGICSNNNCRSECGL